jgi:hypothetical protein
MNYFWLSRIESGVIGETNFELISTYPVDIFPLDLSRSPIYFSCPSPKFLARRLNAIDSNFWAQVFA